MLPETLICLAIVMVQHHEQIHRQSIGFRESQSLMSRQQQRPYRLQFRHCRNHNIAADDAVDTTVSIFFMVYNQNLCHMKSNGTTTTIR